MVLVGLLYLIREVHLDDIITQGQTGGECLSNLETLLGRLSHRRVTVNPKKVKSGLSKIVGHEIDAEGMKFTREKLDSVTNFIKPFRAKELKMFLGLANHFRANVRNMSIIAAPLNRILGSYEKSTRNRRLVWDQESDQAWIEVLDAITNCPKIFFVDADTVKYPIILETDASDYGLGAALFQVFPDQTIPIALMSKSFSADQFKWSTIQKECYAIFYALNKYEYLLETPSSGSRPIT